MSAVRDRHAWRNSAACKGMDPNIFVSSEGARGQTVLNNYRLALSVCAKCVVKNECLEYAIAEGIQYGIFGGMSVRGRRAHARKKGGRS
jgi:WhiB family redox-sensing transcriptional regulator